MYKRFFVHIFIISRVLIVDIHATEFSDAGWRAGDNELLRSMIMLIDNDVFEGKLNKYITRVAIAHGTKDEEGIVAIAFPYLDSDNIRKEFIVVNIDSIDIDTITFSTMYRILLHEMCHIARTIFDGDLGIDDAHGENFMKWVNYAKLKSTIIKNPELVTFYKGVGGIR